MNTSVIDSAYRRFCRERFPLPTEAQIRELEGRIGVSFPADYRHYLLGYNGGYFVEPSILPPSTECPEDCLKFMHGICASHPTAELGRERDLSRWSDNSPPQIVPIGYTIMGYFILLVTHPEGRGQVLLRTFDESFYLSDDIPGFFALLTES
jgi:hypothetical protein